MVNILIGKKWLFKSEEANVVVMTMEDHILFLNRRWIRHHIEILNNYFAQSKFDDTEKSLRRTQLAHDVRTTMYGRWSDVETLKRRRNSVALTSCAGLIAFSTPEVKRWNMKNSWAMSYLMNSFS